MTDPKFMVLLPNEFEGLHEDAETALRNFRQRGGPEGQEGLLCQITPLQQIERVNAYGRVYNTNGKGRPSTLTPPQIAAINTLRAQFEGITGQQIAALVGVSEATISRVLS